MATLIQPSFQKKEKVHTHEASVLAGACKDSQKDLNLSTEVVWKLITNNLLFPHSPFIVFLSLEMSFSSIIIFVNISYLAKCSRRS